MMENKLIPAGFVFVGIFLINAIPHLFYGITGINNYTPLALSEDQTINLIWGIMNLCFAGVIFYVMRNIRFEKRTICIATGALIAIVGLTLYLINDIVSYGFWTVAIIGVFAYSYFRFKRKRDNN